MRRMPSDSWWEHIADVCPSICQGCQIGEHCGKCECCEPDDEKVGEKE